MAEGGGSRGVGGNQPPTHAQDIVKNLFEGDKQKKAPEPQQTTALREQSRAQESLRSEARGREGPSHEEEGKSRRTERDQGPAARARAHTEEAEAPKHEREFDSFLSRSSQQNQQRNAGKEMARPQTMASVNIQGWSVAGSPQTSEGARQSILQKQQSTASQGKAFLQNPPSSQTQNRTPLTTLLPRTLPPQTMPRTGQSMPLTTGLIIRYAKNTQAGGETAARAFQGKNVASENLSRQLGRLVQEQGAHSTGQGLTHAPQIAVHVRGPLIFVRDGDKFRAFKLNKDGSLSELPSEDASEHPLSAEAQAQLQKVLRQKGIHTRMEGGAAHEAGELSEAELAELHSHEHLEGEKEGKGELDFETRFALLLHEVLEEGLELAKKLKEGEDPSFPAKSDWEAFFAKMLGLGNQEKTNKKSLDDIFNMMFRGLFNKKGEINVLVGDLKYMKGGKTKEEKFTQVAISDESLLKLLSELKPGQKISKEVLQKFFGEELSYLELAHVTERLYNMASGAEKNVIFNPKATTDLYSQARLERSLLASRKDPKSGKSPGSTLDAELASQSSTGQNGLFANVYEQLGLRERYRGRPRLYTFIAYSVILASIGTALAYLLLKIL
jgi:hypothetical protein